MSENDRSGTETRRCPNCGLRYSSAKAPGGANIGVWDGPLMLNPCTCVVSKEELCG